MKQILNQLLVTIFITTVKEKYYIEWELGLTKEDNRFIFDDFKSISPSLHTNGSLVRLSSFPDVTQPLNGRARI